MSEIVLCAVSKTYDPGLFKKKVQAVHDLDLEVATGEVYGLIGPNGAGKSTTIRMILGLIRPDRGKITFRGRPLAEASIQKVIGYLPENPYLYDHLTLQELLEFCGRASGMAPARRAARIDELLERVEMTASRRRPLRTFSKGMLQRAGICFALLHDPDVVILDEPMSGLDPIGRKGVFDIVLDLKKAGKTVFFCSHILSDVGRLCDRIGLLVGGKLVREFHHSEFREDSQRPVHLVLGAMSEEQRLAVTAAAGVLLRGAEGEIMSVAPQRLAEVVGHLNALDVQVLATRTERVSLEDLFLKTVKESSQ
ncbi:ABC transporter ATP-binding protein [Trichloromonas sp.]|uniref:ABC transporter ATP-binding protein n=1 Tax=Trichloromonas sp. TaxID=3069249 RepID=UPI003D816DB8